MVTMQHSRSEWESLCSERLRQAQEKYQAARLAAWQAVNDWKKGGVSEPNGSLAFGKALAAERLALRDYREALDAFHDLIIEGKLPLE